MQANRIGLGAAMALCLAGCAYGRIDRLPDEMVARPEENRDLVAAILAGDGERADYLLSTGADVDQRGAGGATPLIAAAATGSRALAARLLDLGADSAAADDTGRNALAHALERDDEPMVTLLVEYARQNY